MVTLEFINVLTEYIYEFKCNHIIYINYSFYWKIYEAERSAISGEAYKKIEVFFIIYKIFINASFFFVRVYTAGPVGGPQAR